MELIFGARYKNYLFASHCGLARYDTIVKNFYPENGCLSEKLVMPYQTERCHNTN
jgi:hypothetical protein